MIRLFWLEDVTSESDNAFWFEKLGASSEEIVDEESLPILILSGN